jgi:hypothetical protein
MSSDLPFVTDESIVDGEGVKKRVRSESMEDLADVMKGPEMQREFRKYCTGLAAAWPIITLSSHLINPPSVSVKHNAY